MVHYWDVPAVLGIGDRPLSADMALECLKYADVNSIILPPAILEELSQSTAESIDVLTKLSYVGFGGGKQKHFGARRVWNICCKILIFAVQ
jgi:hypothetical protein